MYSLFQHYSDEIDLNFFKTLGEENFNLLQIAKPPPEEKGLQNFIGENNCFLNVIIQALWHLDAFRLKFSSPLVKSQHKCTKNCVFCALEVIFTQYEFSEESIIPPTTLREALAVLYGSTQRFQLFQLDDASEALEAVLDRLHRQFLENLLFTSGTEALIKDSYEFVQGQCFESNCIAHQAFGINLIEQLKCDECGSVTEPLESTVFTLYAYVASLRDVAIREKGIHRSSFGDLLLKASQMDRRFCINKGFCTNLCPITHYLISLPEVFTVSIVWNSPNPSLEDIELVMQMIDNTRLDINRLFRRPRKISNRENPYQLRGMVCYYGRHYNAYFYSRRRQRWFVFDDTHVRAIGDSWLEVQQKCIRGRLQPSILFYECQYSKEQHEEMSSVVPFEEDEIPRPAKFQMDNQSFLMSLLKSKREEQHIGTNDFSTVSLNTVFPIHPEPSSKDFDPGTIFISKMFYDDRRSAKALSEQNSEIPVSDKSAVETNTKHEMDADVLLEHFVNISPHSPVLLKRSLHMQSSSDNDDDNPNHNSDRNNDHKPIVETQQNIPERSLGTPLYSPSIHPEESFILLPSPKTNHDLEELDFTVTRTNWLYRKQTRRYRFKGDHFARIIPGTGVVKETFNYMDVLDLVISGDNLVIRFYSDKETQYIESERSREIARLIMDRAAQVGNAVQILPLPSLIQ